MAFSGAAKSKSVIGVLLVVGGIAGCYLFSTTGDLRARAEREHGVKLPPSAAHIQCRGDGWHGVLDRGAVTMFEISSNDLPPFVAQLRVRSRRPPVRGNGDPTVNGYNVWPQRSPTFVPGNSVYAGLK